jgi:HlyD family secretion protein
MSKQAKWITAGLVVLVVAGLSAATAMKRGSKPVDVKIEKVTMRDLVASVTASGQVSPHTKVDLAADISGRITRLSVKEGDMVTKGQFLLQIDPAQYEAAVQRSEAALASARAQAAQSKASFGQAQRNYERSSEIRKTNAQLISDEQLEQLKTAVEVNQALLDAASHSVDMSSAALRDARTQLEKTTILAPMSGRVTRLNVEQGETAVPGTFNKDAATLLTISDMTVLETKVKVDETDVARISVGDSAQVQIDAFPDTTFTGRVVEISNSSVKGAASATGGEAAIDYEVTVRLLNPPTDTRPDFSSTAKIVTDARTKVLSIPIIALTVRENEKIDSTDGPKQLAKGTKQVGKKDAEGVFVIGTDNKVTFRPVKVGISGDKYFEVVSGVKSGEKIVGGTYQAIRELKDGALVRESKLGDTKTKEAKS